MGFSGFVVYTVCSCKPRPHSRLLITLPCPPPPGPSGTHLGITRFLPSSSFRLLMYEHCMQVLQHFCCCCCYINQRVPSKWNGFLGSGVTYTFSPLTRIGQSHPHPHPHPAVWHSFRSSFVLFVFLVCVCVDCEVVLGLHLGFSERVSY